MGSKKSETVAPTVEELLKIIQADPYLARAFEQMRQQNQTDETARKYSELAKTVMKMATVVLKFSPQAAGTMMVVFDVLVPLSLYCKKNVLDNPEVRKFMSETFERATSGSKAALYIVSGLISDQIERMAEYAKRKVA